MTGGDLSGRTADLERLVLLLAARTGWSEREITALPLRRLLRYINTLEALA